MNGFMWYDKNISGDDFSFDSHFTPESIKDSIKDLKQGKSSGYDTLASEHYNYASSRIYVLLSMLFHCCVSHGYLPIDMSDTVIVPVPRDKRGNITDKDKYRSIALTSIWSKMFEILILTTYEHLLVTPPDLFGFVRGLGTDSYISQLNK